ncbi:ubiquitin conjugation factor E4 [Byssothecium circinans]|uniref:Ubiquitin conjugation factor E4 n=1 Tax=Byssothecium circinans TaxID=147558 RepID=A0A6A5U5C5_9PLEO|nr:ubiquitin conjugation factor E4 [Byssothecium circinans]
MADQPPENDRPQPDAMSDADKIRAKRLAKLGGSSNAIPASSSTLTPPATTPAPSTPQPDTAPAPTPISTPTPAAQPTTSPNPFAQLGMKEETRQVPRINITPRPEADSNGNAGARTASSSAESNLKAWTDKTISAIFRITLNPDQTVDAHGHRLYFVKGVRQDLEDANTPIRFTPDLLDSAILESAQSKSEGKALDYLLGCWKRVCKLFRGMSNKKDPKFDIVKEARRVCFSYAIFAATIPDMFNEVDTGKNQLVDHLLVEAEHDRGICHDFLNEAISRFDEDDSVKELLVGAIEELSRRLSKLTMNDDYRSYMSAMRSFAHFPPLVKVMVQSPLFLPSGLEPKQIESKTLLGPYFTISPLQGEVALNYFSGPTTRDKSYISNAQNSLRLTLQTHQDELFEIAHNFVKVKESRDRMLDWFAMSLNANHKRRAMRVDPKTVSSDAFMVNITVILDRLCEPFMDATFSKIDRIEIDYLRRSPRVSIKDETKINADQQISDEYYQTTLEGTNNFITEVFFLTVAAHHYGIEAANTKLSSLEKDMKYLEKELAKMETERHKYASNPMQLAVFDGHLKKMKDQIERGQCSALATRGVLLDQTTQGRSMQFMRYVIVWMLRLVSPQSKFPQRPIQLPLPDEQPMAFRCLPEYFLEDICDNFKFITQYMPHVITSTQCEELMVVCITFLRSSEYIKNPYLKAHLVRILFNGIWPVPGRSKGVLGDVLFAHKFATQHLLHALMKFYIECERTHDKYNIRYEIFQVIKCIWPNSIYRENLRTEAQVNLDFFVQFVNLLLNDVTFVLDESFTAFKTIHDISKTLRAPDSGLDENTRQEQEERMSSAQEKAKGYMQLTNETVAMLKLFTESLGDSFTRKEVVVRLAHMLDYNLEALVGPKKADLKVENPQDYHWNPRQLLSDIADVYLNLKEKQSFLESVATDDRSYRPDYFVEAAKILSRFALKAPEQLAEWDQLAERIRVVKETLDMEDADLGDVPDEYLDPLLASLMEDPVILPISKQTLDRSTVQSHLLSDPHDPFNRAPLSIDQVIPNDALREEIQKWKAERLAEKRAERNAAAAGEPMDLS